MRFVALLSLVALVAADDFTARIVAKKDVEPRHRAGLMAQMTPPLNTAQIRGTRFVTAFINSHISDADTSYTENLAFIITNTNAGQASVQISSPYNGFNNITVSIPPGISQVVPILPADIQTNYMDKYISDAADIESKSIWIDSDMPVSVVASNSHSDGGSEDKYDVYPICTLGTEYHAVADESMWLSQQLQSTNIITVIALEDNTWVDLTQLVTNGNITINKGQTYTVVTKYYVSDIVFTSGKPVAAVSGAVCGFGYLLQDTCSFESVMLYPTSAWGKDAYFYKYQPEDAGEVIILAKDDGTVVKVDGKPTAKPLNRLDYLILNFLKGAAITSDRQIQVVGVGSSNGTGYGAPFFVQVPATENFISDPIQFLVAINDDEAKNMQHVVRIETNVETIGKIAFDAYTPSGLLYKRMGRSNVYFVELSAAPGTHTLTPQAGVSYSATVYGYGYRRQYAYTPAMDLPTNGGTC